jgi:hypothetical protein
MLHHFLQQIPLELFLDSGIAITDEKDPRLLANAFVRQDCK